MKKKKAGTKTRIPLKSEEEMKIKELLTQGLTPTAVAFMTNRSISSVYKMLRALRQEKPKAAAVSHLRNLTVTPRSE